MKARRLHIVGTVQGVGFRPFIYRLACENGLAGWVLNAGDGVHLHVQGAPCDISSFLSALPVQAPPASHIIEIYQYTSELEELQGFVIRESSVDAVRQTDISPDIATCPACLAELNDLNDRRYHYPFINCTNCGPRFTIINDLPYDRSQTTMADFLQCPDCAAEYRDQNNRRFHAQPNACFACGPVLSLTQKDLPQAIGNTAASSDALIARVTELLLDGKIVAIKGIGGYQLACDATNEAAVLRLRRRKQRPSRPFALMVASCAVARCLCEVNSQEAKLLSGSSRPIVLLQRREPAAADEYNYQPDKQDIQIAPSVADPLPELGVMLPTTALHQLLLAAIARPLVMTSANLSEEPIIAANDEAHSSLYAIADAFLDNNRPIISRYDDSVVRVVNGQVQFIRRARGYAPAPLSLAVGSDDVLSAQAVITKNLGEAGNSGKEQPGGLSPVCSTNQNPVIFACGAEQKSNFCFLREGKAIVSQHLGDLDNVNAFANYQDTRELYQRLFDLSYTVLVCDAHPNYRASLWAREQREKCTVIEVQHHHAHIAAVLAENGLAWGQQVIGLALDGTGYGSDGTVWGGEVLVASLSECTRFASLEPVALPGGAAAILHPDRMAYALLKQYDLLKHPAAQTVLKRLGKMSRATLDRLIDTGLNTPQTSSAGRLFDAVSALLGICHEPSYDGQAAVLLEAALWQEAKEKARFSLQHDQRYHFSVKDGKLSPAPLLFALLEDLATAVPISQISLQFHRAWLDALAAICHAVRQATEIKTVALSGGVFINRFLATYLPARLTCEGFTVLSHKDLPANDGCIAYGQAAVALAQIIKTR